MIKHQRTKCGFTQSELASKLNIDKQYVSKLENGKVNMTLDYLDKIIKKLGDNHQDFFQLGANRITKKQS